MKRKLILMFSFLFLTTNVIFSQVHKGLGGERRGIIVKDGVIYFKDSSNVSGKIEITYDQKLIHHVNREKVIYDYRTIDYVSLKKDGKVYNYCFRKRDEETVLIERLSKGNVELFLEEYLNGGDRVWARNSIGIGPVAISISMPGREVLTTKFYIGTKDNYHVVKLPKNRKRRKFRKILAKYYAKCAAFNDKMEDKNFFGTKTELEIINYFNENCN